MSEHGGIEDEVWTVGQVAEELGVTVRTLHHYDGIGLLRPSERSRAGYRLYTVHDLRRLARIVLYRRLELPLDEVAALLDDPGPDAVEHLKRQRDLVRARRDELVSLEAAIEREITREIENHQENTMNEQQPATREQMKEIFGDGFKDEYQQEAKERWGQTDAWKQSAARTKRYTKADWEQVKAEQEAVGQAFVAALTSGEPATSDRAMDAAERARLQIHERFYDCSHAFHRNLGDMYIGDPRFAKYYEDLAPGLAQYVRDAIHANADRFE